jgi:aminoglycoside phosphotransferase (APT) family kinase protein
VSKELTDKPRAVRAGEEIDAAKLSAYLRGRVEGLDAPLSVEQFPSGFSNLTYLLRSGERELVLRRPPVGAKIKTAHDMAREYRILTGLRPVYPKVARAVFYCADEEVIGAPFYLMERVRGIILRAQPPAGLELSTETLRRLSQSFVENLVEIHAVDFEAAGLGELGRPDGYIRRQIEGWTKRYRDAQTDEVPGVEHLASWLAERVPSDSTRAALIHNDYKYDNLVLSPDDTSEIVAVLDWEMATVGDPLMDLGTSLSYWVDADDSKEWQQYGFSLTALPGNLSRAELLELYTRQSGREVADPVFFYAYGLLKVAVIVQQIYKRFRQGLTRDARFAHLGLLVHACGEQAARAIERRRIDRLG